MRAKNMVIAGDYLHKPVETSVGASSIRLGFFKLLILDKKSIESYELLTDEHYKSAANGIGRGLVGGALLGPVGLLAGLSAKNKGIYTVAIKFRDGKSSLLEVDDKAYKCIIKHCF